MLSPSQCLLRILGTIILLEPCSGAGYTLLRGLTGRVTGQADEPGFAPALAEIEEALVPALIVEKPEDGSYIVLVP